MGADMKKSRYSSEVRERSVRMVFERREQHSSQWAAIESIAGKIGCSAQTLSSWITRHEIDHGKREGVSTVEAEHVHAMERENKELRCANEILKLASAFFAQADPDRRLKSRDRSSTSRVRALGSSRIARSCNAPIGIPSPCCTPA
jgi:transposase